MGHRGLFAFGPVHVREKHSFGRPAMALQHAVLTVAEMYRADALTIEGGKPGEVLMEAAGAAVAREIVARWPVRPVSILCGPGNNGGDGFVVARLLDELGWPIRVGLLGDRSALRGDAAIMAGRWKGQVLPLSSGLLDGVGLVVDALFGAGLARPLEGSVRELVEDLGARGIPVVAVDVPSGVDGDTGAVRGAASRAEVTVTFFRRKPAHLMMPGRRLCGTVVVADIGIEDAVLEKIAPKLLRNDPAIWLSRFPWPKAEGHKFDRGHAVVLGGARMTGAARLAARAARRVGAGLVSIACPAEAFPIYAAADPGTIVTALDTAESFGGLMSDPRRNAVLIGPGAGISAGTRRRVEEALEAGKALVIDADAITAFADRPADLFEVLTERCLLTPHSGEFKRLFGIEGDRLSQARAAADRAGAIVLLKGADTVISRPDGIAVINGNAPPWLATAGAGDVLAGLAVGLIAQGMPTFDAAAAAAWLHGEAATRFGHGLIAEDIAEALPGVLRDLAGSRVTVP
jgi:ADP-dependent NAD(P)H-hydrate dehydratase / NAD(P)H-hydrate epimerase